MISIIDGKRYLESYFSCRIIIIPATPFYRVFPSYPLVTGHAYYLSTMEGSLYKWTNYYSGRLNNNHMNIYLSIIIIYTWTNDCTYSNLIYYNYNYFQGWQSRWFILDNGVLSYYLSPEEVTQGSRGSVKVASCNIIG